ncbi:AI-2E family transporter [Dactylosporangium sp. NPDC000521]|uniref:AI-2E family transporter n=1 Tax=Dactylosporangium sp. NPDC000521 TaxID=3363975 RepID=UPI00368F4765
MIVVQQVEGILLVPLIVGRALRLHPAVVLIAVTVGGLTAGIAGAIVAVRLTAGVYQIVKTVAATRPTQPNPPAAPEPGATNRSRISAPSIDPPS